MFGLPPGNGDHMNQPRGPLTSLKEEPLGARAWMQPIDQTKYEVARISYNQYEFEFIILIYGTRNIF